MKSRIISLLFVFFLFFCATSALAHPGATDEYGGHYDYESGEYHYHHGYPAHRHGFGTCPYDFDDRTGEDSGTSGGGSSIKLYTTAPRPTRLPRATDSPRHTSSHSFFRNHLWLFVILVPVGIISLSIIVCVRKEKARERLRQQQFEIERQKAIAFYSTNDLRTLTKMPDIYYVEGRIPYEYNKPKGTTYGGTLDVYVSFSRSSEVYHAKGCSHASFAMPKNIYSDNAAYCLRSRRPCSVCKPNAFPDIQWYREYTKHLSECERYGITPKQDPENYTPPPAPPHIIALPEHTEITPPSAPPLPSVNVSVKVTPTTPQQATIVSDAPPALPLEPAEDDLPNAPAVYRQNYPRTWAYIQRHSKNAYSYVYYYHYVWGKLQEHHGDGIIYGTLSSAEQDLVNYPHVGETVFISSEDSDSYHSTPNCYSLLKSNPVEVDAMHGIVRKRCTKCVPPQSPT